MIPVEIVSGFREEGLKKSSRGGEFKYNIFDTLLELFKILQCTPTKHNNNKKKVFHLFYFFPFYLR
jgi:hypothetical protein